MYFCSRGFVIIISYFSSDKIVNVIQMSVKANELGLLLENRDKTFSLILYKMRRNLDVIVYFNS